MSDSFKLGRIRNLKDLEEEQERLQETYKEMESNWTTVILPSKLIGKQVLFNRLKGKKNKEKAATESSKGLLGKILPSKSKGKEIASVQSTSQPKKYKKLGKRLLVWQLVSLALFVGVEIYRDKKKRKVRRVSASKND